MSRQNGSRTERPAQWPARFRLAGDRDRYPGTLCRGRVLNVAAIHLFRSIARFFRLERIREGIINPKKISRPVYPFWESGPWAQPFHIVKALDSRSGSRGDADYILYTPERIIMPSRNRSRIVGCG